MSDTQQILTEAAEWLRSGRGVALATVVSTWGSSPRPVGSKLAVDDTGHMIGSVSGGCVEGAVGDEQAWEVGLACGGRVRIFVEKLS